MRDKAANASLRALSPLDGRYADKVEPLRAFLSEWALMKYRAKVEIEWLIKLSQQPEIPELDEFSRDEIEALRSLVKEFDDAAARRVKQLERETNHDVKAVEYYLREKLLELDFSEAISFIHFACTSEDINNVAYALMFRAAMKLWLARARELVAALRAFAKATAATAMLSNTHGQAATPTTFGKEMAVFVHRLQRQLFLLDKQEYLGKFNGAVGAFNAHRAAYPNVDWLVVSQQFVESFGLTHNRVTTQAEPHDWLAELAHSLMRCNTGLLDLCRDIWTYCQLNMLAQSSVDSEVGSSTMPHKINPIDFENAEGNLGVSNAILGHLADKLPVSRLQRDLSDSTALRNFGVALAHSYLALLSSRRGLSKLKADEAAMSADLAEAWELLAEAVQTVMRKHGVNDAYEQLKCLTRGKSVSAGQLRAFIQELEIPKDDKERLLRLEPKDYIGYAERLAVLENPLGDE